MTPARNESQALGDLAAGLEKQKLAQVVAICLKPAHLLEHGLAGNVNHAPGDDLIQADRLE